MRIVVLGTGEVGRALAAGLLGAGHDVAIGTRDPEETLSRTEPDQFGRPPFAAWYADHAGIPVVGFTGAAAGRDLVVNATAGTASVSAVREVGDDALAGKVVMDVSNPLVFEREELRLLWPGNDSVAERIQQAVPRARVVKALNTMNARVMVEPGLVPDGHTVFVAGDEDEAKQVVAAVLRGLGWPAASIVDLGGLDGARAAEAYVLLAVRLMNLDGGSPVNIEVRRG